MTNNEKEKEKDGTTEVIEKQKLRSMDDLDAAFEYVFNQQTMGKIDSKAAETLNKTLHGSVAIKKLRLEAAKLNYMAQLKKIHIPNSLMIELAQEQKESLGVK